MANIVAIAYVIVAAIEGQQQQQQDKDKRMTRFRSVMFDREPTVIGRCFPLVLPRCLLSTHTQAHPHTHNVAIILFTMLIHLFPNHHPLLLSDPITRIK